MDMQRNEYPSMLASLQPSQATQILNDRLKHVDKLNSEIADWLQERRRVEEVYINGLRRLARKQPPDESSDLGVFGGPWNMLANSMEALAESHHLFVRKTQLDIEKPLREYATHDRQMQQMSNMQGNLNAIAKEYEAAQRKAAKGRSGRTSDDMEGATQQWESQAPYVFETLQAVDESRCNHLRDVLTQYQTHEVDSVEKNRVAAEQCLNALLNVETAEEIKSFSQRNSGPNLVQQQKRSRRDSRVIGGALMGAASTPSSSAAGPTQSVNRDTLAPPSNTALGRPSNGDDAASQRSVNDGDDGMIQEKKRFGGIKRLGTVLSRRRQSTMPPTRPSPQKKDSSASRFGSSFRSDRHDKPTKIPEGSPSPPRSRRGPSPAAVLPPVDVGERLDSSQQRRDPSAQRERSTSRTNGISQPPRGSSLSNGASNVSRYTQVQQAEQPPLPPKPVEEPQPQQQQQQQQQQRDDEGYTVPPPAVDPISQAQAEAADSQDPSNQNFKVDIRNAPISEEGPAAETAMANVASTLRARAQQAGPARRTGTLRGRRDVRNTVFVPNPTTAEALPPIEQQLPGGISTTSLPPASNIPPAFPTPPPISSLQQQQQPSQTMSPTLASLNRQTTGDAPVAEGIAPFTPAGPAAPSTTASDTQSVRSNRSLSSLANVIKHPELHTPGLSASIVETVSATLTAGTVEKCTVIGELALAHNSPFISAPSSPTSPMTAGGSSSETIRLDNFPILEKVAPNPAFVHNLPESPGTYALDLQSISASGTRPQVAFKYQLHLEPSTLTTHCPILITPTWKVESTQTSAIVSYSLNPSFRPSSHPSNITSLILVLHLEGNARTPSCQSKPTGTFSREKALIYWKLDASSLTPHGKPEKLLARFATTDGAARPGRVEARWEVEGAGGMDPRMSMAEGGEGVEALGSGLSVSTLDAQAQGQGSDPFSDEGADAVARERQWNEVGMVRRLVAGSYVAT
ncbi:MAG: hypothetical protein M1828_007031 [Chrysothrix sp. TS-e1954]|nr:MAG: hypothetical protein M1828_007031 [Chrysothrix sp. TS-e1954]